MAGFFVMAIEKQIFKLLTAKGRLPEFIAMSPKSQETECLGNVKKIVLRTGTRKAEFFQQRLQKFKDEAGETIPTETRESVWDEDAHAGAYMMPGMRATLKSAVELKDAPEISAPGELHISGDVETMIGDVLLSKPDKQKKTEEIAMDIANMLAHGETTFNVRSSIAGLMKDANRGASLTEQHQFKVDDFDLGDIRDYVDSVTRQQLERAPGGILWPHPIIISKINEVDGVKRGEEGFDQRLISLFNALLNIPDGIDVLVRFMDTLDLRKPLMPDGNLHKFLVSSSEKPLIGRDETVIGNWTEIVPLSNGELLELGSIGEDDYMNVSRVAENNFRHAPNYNYLQTDDKKEELEKFVEANSPANVETLCNTPIQLCNLVAKINDEVVGYRVVRKKIDEDDGVVIADGRRMHVALGKDGMGLGTFLLRRSEQIARQQGCEVMEIHATGTSHEWFLKQGYRMRSQVANERGVFKDKPSVFFLMIKDMKEVV